MSALFVRLALAGLLFAVPSAHSQELKPGTRDCARGAPTRWSRGWFAAPDVAVTRNGLTLLGLVAAVVVMAADQASKWWILDVVQLPAVSQIVLLPVLNLTMVWNRGVTFGLLTNFSHWSYLLLTAIALAVVAGLMVWLRRAESRLVTTALSAG